LIELNPIRWEILGMFLLEAVKKRQCFRTSREKTFKDGTIVLIVATTDKTCLFGLNLLFSRAQREKLGFLPPPPPDGETQ
jgi:hypothetical protein